MLVIRYFRIGKKNQPYFKIVVTDKRRPARGGRFVEEVGSFDPVKKKKTLNAERIKFWISKGAQPSDSLHNLLISEKIIEGKKRDVHKKKKVTGGTPAPAAVPAKPVAASVVGESRPEDSGQEKLVEVPVEALKEEAPKEEPKEESVK